MIRPTRRSVLASLTAGSAAMIPGAPARADQASRSADEGMCFLTPQSEEGPFYTDPKLLRGDITEGRAGVPMRLRLRVIEAGPCTPVAGARVDLWHCDARGLYSGYPGQDDDHAVDTTGQTFLRGTQMANGDGWAVFDTIYPGWYEGRATHAHFKVFIDHRTVAMGQVFFPDALSEFLYANVPAYAGRPFERSVVNANDHVVTGADPSRLGFCAIREKRDRYVATMTLGIDRSATVAQHLRAPPGPPPGGFGGPPSPGRPPGGPGGDAPAGFPPGPPPGGPPQIALKDRLSALVPGLSPKT